MTCKLSRKKSKKIEKTFLSMRYIHNIIYGNKKVESFTLNRSYNNSIEKVISNNYSKYTCYYKFDDTKFLNPFVSSDPNTLRVDELLLIPTYAFAKCKKSRIQNFLYSFEAVSLTEYNRHSGNKINIVDIYAMNYERLVNENKN